MDVRKIVVIVEEVEAARTALKWALNNLLRYGDLITLLHVFSPTKSRSKAKNRLLRLKGYQLALSFKEICNTFFNTNIEIIVTEGDQDGGRIVDMVRGIGASALVVGLHEQSFLYKLAMAHSNVANNFNCRVLAIKQPRLPQTRISTSNSSPTSGSETPISPISSTNMDFSQIDLDGLEFPDIEPPKIPYRICPDPNAIIWRWRKPKKRS